MDWGWGVWLENGGGDVSGGLEDGRASLVAGCLMAVMLLCGGCLEDRCGIDRIDQSDCGG